MLPNPLMTMMDKQQGQGQVQGQVKRPMPGLPINPGGSMYGEQGLKNQISGNLPNPGGRYSIPKQEQLTDDIQELDMEDPAEEQNEDTAKLDAGFVSADEHCEFCMHMSGDGMCQRYGWPVVDGDGCKEGFEPEGGEDILGEGGETEEPEEMEEVEETEEVKE